MSILTKKISGMYVLIVTSFFTVATMFLLMSYSAIHLDATKLTKLTYSLDILYEDEVVVSEIESNDKLKSFFNQLKKSNKSHGDSNRKLMGTFSMYHITGLLGFMVSLLSLFCKPRKLAFVSIILGVFCLFQSVVTI